MYRKPDRKMMKKDSVCDACKIYKECLRLRREKCNGHLQWTSRNARRSPRRQKSYTAILQGHLWLTLYLRPTINAVSCVY